MIELTNHSMRWICCWQIMRIHLRYYGHCHLHRSCLRTIHLHLLHHCYHQTRATTRSHISRIQTHLFLLVRHLIDQKQCALKYDEMTWLTQLFLIGRNTYLYLYRIVLHLTTHFVCKSIVWNVHRRSMIWYHRLVIAMPSSREHAGTDLSWTHESCTAKESKLSEKSWILQEIICDNILS